MKVVVTDANSRVALAVVRALGRAGHRVLAVEQRRFASRTPAAFVSRHVSDRRVLPDLEDGFVAALAEVSEDADVVIPVSTNVLLAVARERSPKVPVPPLETMLRANDKMSVLDVARRAGVPVPEIYSPGNARFPAVVKMRDDAGTYLDPGERYRIVSDAAEMREALAAFPSAVVQEKVEGDARGCGFLARDGELLAAFCHRRVREYPIAGGPSAMCESIVDGTLTAHARALARELRWTGVAMAEFKGGRLLEINPRFWGSLPLALRAGINFPDLLCRMAAGQAVGPVGSYRAGVRLRFLMLDLAAAWQAMRARRGRTVGGFLRDLLDPRVSDGILELDDLRASMAYVASRV
ncbi:MAG: ATP-grasp domain-containing protein [Planctomycetes bacterium]|nr:ATP-grasp domain-containing protein [Planctomycetota bacterium]